MSGLRALLIEGGVDEARAGCLYAPIVVVAEGEFLFFVEVIVNARREKRFGILLTGVLGEGIRAGNVVPKMPPPGAWIFEFQNVPVPQPKCLLPSCSGPLPLVSGTAFFAAGALFHSEKASL